MQVAEAVEDLVEQGPGVTLVITDEGMSREVNREIVRQLTADLGLSGVYVTVERPYTDIVEDFEDAGIDLSTMEFVDAITNTTDVELVEQEGVAFMESPSHLTDISLAMEAAVERIEGDRFLFFESLSGLKGPRDRFGEFLAGKLREWDVRGVLLSIERTQADAELVERLRDSVDDIVEIRSGETDTG